MYTIHATRKLLDRVRQPIEPTPPDPTTAMGNWYATALFWKPQVALLVNERTLFPVFMPLAPAATLADRFTDTLRHVLTVYGAPVEFTGAEIAEMTDCLYAKTANRSLVGMTNEFSFLADVHRSHGDTDLVGLSLRLSRTPCGPLHKRHVTPDRELDALISAWMNPTEG